MIHIHVKCWIYLALVTAYNLTAQTPVDVIDINQLAEEQEAKMTGVVAEAVFQGVDTHGHTWIVVSISNYTNRPIRYEATLACLGGTAYHEITNVYLQVGSVRTPIDADAALLNLCEIILPPRRSGKRYSHNILIRMDPEVVTSSGDSTVIIPYRDDGGSAERFASVKIDL